MVVYGWDASHYDGLLTTAILARARAEGITFFTHKIAEGLSDTEGTLDDTALAGARAVGMEFIGGYLVPRSNATVAAQVDRWLALADAGEPWWRPFPGWFWQIDLERWSYDNVPASVGIACAQEIRRRTGRWTILYASHGQYGDELAGWDGPIWNADYVSRPAGGIAQMYPGDDWQPLHGTWRGGWAPYSGREPTFLQHTSSATIAGLTTCDGNAYRGTIDQLRALISGGTAMALADEKIPPFKRSDQPRQYDPAMAYGITEQSGGWTWADAWRLMWWQAYESQNVILKMVGDLAEARKEIAALATRVDQLQTGGQPTQAQVDAGILKAMLDPAVQKGIGDAIAAHLHVT